MEHEMKRTTLFFILLPAVMNRHRGALMCDVNLFLLWNMSHVIFLFCFHSCLSLCTSYHWPVGLKRSGFLMSFGSF